MPSTATTPGWTRLLSATGRESRELTPEVIGQKTRGTTPRRGSHNARESCFAGIGSTEGLLICHVVSQWAPVPALFLCYTRFVSKLRWFLFGVLIIICVRVVWIYHSRRAAERDVQKQVAQRQVDNARSTIAAYGGDKLTILQFYATPAAIHRGETAQICYGVSNAKDVRIDPPVENVWPSLDRCVDVTPKRNTTYNLIAQDASGHTEKATVTVAVR